MLNVKNVIHNIISAYITYVWYWLSMALMLFLPTYFWNIANVSEDDICLCIFNLLVYSIFVSGVIVSFGLILRRFSSRSAKIWLCLAFIITMLISFGEVFMIKFFHTRYASFIFQLVDETNNRESVDFIVAYCSTLKFLAIFFLYIVVFGIGTILLNKLSWFVRFRKHITFCLFWILFIGVFVNCIGNQVSSKRQYPMGEDSFSYLYNAYNSFLKSKEECLICDNMHRSIVVDSCTYSSPKIFLLIGESFNKYHSSLYGYKLPTNPNLSKLDNLFVFTDVITSVNGTSYSFHNFMSMASVGEERSWAEAPLFMSFFKKAGYYVTFYSNQFPKRFHTDSFDFEGSYFFDQPMIDSTCFDFRNTEVYQYDGDMLDNYEADRKEKIDIGEHRLTIIHFLGQHMLPESRYPIEYTYFTADSIDRPDLAEKYKQEIAHYDNATRYNDTIVYRVIDMYKDEDAIFIYFSDHGDEVNDFRIHRGRSFDIALGAPLLHCQMDIPFVIYATSLYKKKHPDIIARIAESVNRPFMTDDLPHLMLDLAGISTSWYNPTKSIINSNYNSKRKRLVGYVSRYDYDSICSPKY